MIWNQYVQNKIMRNTQTSNIGMKQNFEPIGPWNEDSNDFLTFFSGKRTKGQQKCKKSKEKIKRMGYLAQNHRKSFDSQKKSPIKRINLSGKQEQKSTDSKTIRKSFEQYNSCLNEKLKDSVDIIKSSSKHSIKNILHQSLRATYRKSDLHAHQNVRQQRKLDSREIRQRYFQLAQKIKSKNNSIGYQKHSKKTKFQCKLSYANILKKGLFITLYSQKDNWNSFINNQNKQCNKSKKVDKDAKNNPKKGKFIFNKLYDFYDY